MARLPIVLAVDFVKKTQLEAPSMKAMCAVTPHSATTRLMRCTARNMASSTVDTRWAILIQGLACIFDVLAEWRE